jgi:hypothetical protein
VDDFTKPSVDTSAFQVAELRSSQHQLSLNPSLQSML